jgi:hypothetical protein
MINNDWLSNLKAGDRVYINRGSSIGYNLTPAIVERTTKTTIIVNDSKYRKSDGVKQGNWDYFTPQLCEATEAIDAKYREYQLRRDLEKVNFSKLRIDQVERILAIVKEV